MATLSVDDIILKISEYFSSKENFKVVGIFGSYAKNKANPGSDIDICTAAASPLTSEEKIKTSTDLSLLLKKEVDLLDLNATQGVILKETLHSAIWIRKDSAYFAQVLKRMLFDQADFQPYYQRMLQKKRERFLKK